MNQTPPLLVVGTGAMACMFAARLSASGQKVTMLGSWLEGLQALNRDGVRTRDENGTVKSYPVFATDNPLLCTGTKFALILVKAYQTRLAAEKLRTCLAPEGLALTLQNGAGNLYILVEALGKERAAGGITNFGATQLQPGMIHPHDKGEIFIGAAPRLEPLVEMLRVAGFVVNIRDEINSLIWGKLVVNCAANPLSALLGLSNGELVENPYARQMVSLAAEEAARVAVALGIQLPFENATSHVENILTATPHNRTSMYQDLHRGSPESEIDAINGAVVEYARQAGVPAPYNQALTLLIKALFNSRKGEST